MHGARGIGGIVQLRTQRRAAEISRFLRLLLRVAFEVIFLFGLLFLGAWLGERLCGGHWIGIVGSAVLFTVVGSRFRRLSWSEKPSAPPRG
jgi:hypothetical protein